MPAGKKSKKHTANLKRGKKLEPTKNLSTTGKHIGSGTLHVR